MGFCGAVDAGLAPGDLGWPTSCAAPAARCRACPGAELIAGALRRAGLRVHVGALACTTELVRGSAERERLRAQGVLAVDMESIWLVGAARPGAGAGGGERPFAVVRAVVDVPGRELRHLPATVTGALAAARSLRRCVAPLAGWARAVAPRDVLMAAPRAACAGVDRAIEIVEAVLEQRGSPLYVRRQIVHNTHVVRELEQRGVTFVAELDEVPDGATVVFSAHGVAPAVRREAAGGDLEVVDATCPLVSKVHAEARRFAGAGRTILLIGHAGHDEVEGVLGEAPDQIQLVGDLAEAERVQVADPERVAYLTQTTLAVDETATVVLAELVQLDPAAGGRRACGLPGAADRGREPDRPRLGRRCEDARHLRRRLGPGDAGGTGSVGAEPARPDLGRGACGDAGECAVQAVGRIEQGPRGAQRTPHPDPRRGLRWACRFVRPPGWVGTCCARRCQGASATR